MKTGDFMAGEAETSDWQKAVEAWGRASWVFYVCISGT